MTRIHSILTFVLIILTTALGTVKLKTTENCLDFEHRVNNTDVKIIDQQFKCFNNISIYNTTNNVIILNSEIIFVCQTINCEYYLNIEKTGSDVFIVVNDIHLDCKESKICKLNIYINGANNLYIIKNKLPKYILIKN